MSEALPIPGDRLITVEEAASLLGMSVRWVWQQISIGAFHAVKPSGNPRGRTRLLLSEIQGFIARLAGGKDGAI